MVVPKRLFFFWGNPVMSWFRYMTLYSARKYNPDWKIELYVTDVSRDEKYWKECNEQDFFMYKGENYFNRIQDLNIEIKQCPRAANIEGAGPSHMSNFFKWRELSEEGGVYADMDILFLKPLDDWYESIKRYDSGLSWYDALNHGYFSIGFMFSSGQSILFNDIYDNAKETFREGKYQSAGVDALYRIVNVKLNGLRLKPSERIRVSYSKVHYIPMDTVYPFLFNQSDERFSLCIKELPEKCLGIHWYAGDPAAQVFNSTINERNLQSQCNTMTYFLDRVLND